jgi:hypothetical protein
MPTHHRRSSGAVRSRRQLVWAEATGNITLAATNGTNNLSLVANIAPTGADGIIGATVMRTRIRIHVQNWAAVGDEIFVGCLVGRAQDLGTTVSLAGAGSLDWYFRADMFATTNGATINASQIYDFDVKSRRKAGEFAQVPLIAFENESAATKNLDYFVRTLIALP